MSDDKENKNISDILKKVVNTGISAAFMTEDAVKNVLQDLPLPKEIVNGLVANAKNTKDEFITSVKSELSSYLDKIDISKELDKLAQNYDLEVSAKVKLVPKNKAKNKKAPAKKTGEKTDSDNE